MAAAVLLTAAVTSCTDSKDSDELESRREQTTEPNQFGDYSAAQSEYESAVDQLEETLPAGQTFPAVLPGEWEEGATFEEGVGEGAAAMYWRCVWLHAYAAAHEVGDAAATATALERLADWTSLPQMLRNADTELAAQWEKRAIEPARGGDNSLLLDLASRCSLD